MGYGLSLKVTNMYDIKLKIFIYLVSICFLTYNCNENRNLLRNSEFSFTLTNASDTYISFFLIEESLAERVEIADQITLPLLDKNIIAPKKEIQFTQTYNSKKNSLHDSEKRYFIYFFVSDVSPYDESLYPNLGIDSLTLYYHTVERYSLQDLKNEDIIFTN